MHGQQNIKKTYMVETYRPEFMLCTINLREL